MKNVKLSTGKVITHTRANNGSIDAMPEMTKSEHGEYWNIKNYVKIIKTRSELWDQYNRVSDLCMRLRRREIKKADPRTDGVCLLCHNWGNDESVKMMNRYDNRLSRLFYIHQHLSNAAFIRENPDHIVAKLKTQTT